MVVERRKCPDNSLIGLKIFSLPSFDGGGVGGGGGWQIPFHQQIFIGLIHYYIN